MAPVMNRLWCGVLLITCAGAVVGCTAESPRFSAVPSSSPETASSPASPPASNDSGALFIQTYGDIDQVTIEGNLFEGGGYQLGLEAGFDHVYGRNMRAINNRFSGTGWGASYVTDKGLDYGWSVWRDNHLNDSSKPGNKGRTVAA